MILNNVKFVQEKIKIIILINMIMKLLAYYHAEYAYRNIRQMTILYYHYVFVQVQ